MCFKVSLLNDKNTLVIKKDMILDFMGFTFLRGKLTIIKETKKTTR